MLKYFKKLPSGGETGGKKPLGLEERGLNQNPSASMGQRDGSQKQSDADTDVVMVREVQVRPALHASVFMEPV